MDAAVATLRSILEIDPQERDAIAALEQHLRGGRAITASGSRCCASASTWPATRPRARSCGGASRGCWNATSATSTRRSPPASASSTRTRRTIRRWRRWRGSTSSRGATASAWRSWSGGWGSPAALATRSGSGCCGRSRRCWKGRSAIRPTRSGAGARCWRRRPPTSDALAALERFLAPGTDGGLRLAAAQALEPIYESNGRFAELAAVVRVYVEAQTDARGRLEQLMRLASLEEARLGDKEAARATTALRDPRRAGGARAGGAARQPTSG